MPRFRQRLTEVEAIQYDGSPENERAIFDLAGTPSGDPDRGRTIKATFGRDVVIGDWFIRTNIGVMRMADAEFRSAYDTANPLAPVRPK